MKIYIRASEISPEHVTVNDDYYRSVVGTPRGFGNWFFFRDKACQDFTNAIEIFGKYSEAKLKARKEAAKRGYTTIYLGT